jgi:hypothetical protein
MMRILACVMSGMALSIVWGIGLAHRAKKWIRFFGHTMR